MSEIMRYELVQGEADHVEVVEQVEQSMENQLAAIGSSAVKDANEMVISDAASNKLAADYLIEIKRRAKAVTEYWKEPKEAAKASHQKIVNLEKAMLKPLNEAEATIKQKMLAYQVAEAKARAAAEAEAARLQREERERMLAQAIEAEKAGDTIGAEANLAMAAIVEDMAAPIVAAAPKVEGISTRKVWKARVIDPALVPIMANGFEIRPVDMKMLQSIATTGKGKVSIPGVEFYEESVLAVRG